jgi:RNA polymerase sigma factor (sigma-70 family)
MPSAARVSMLEAMATWTEGILAQVSSSTEPDPSIVQPSDGELVERCRRGDRRAWEQLVRRFERLIYTVPRRAGLSEADAGDVFQTVFERLHRHLGSLSQPQQVQAWLVTTARRESLRLLREGRRTQPFSALGNADDDDEAGFENSLEDSAPLPEDLLEQLQLQHRVRLALSQLKEPCGTLLTLLYFCEEPQSYAELSKRLNMPTGSIGPTRARCLGKLRTLMEAQR